MWVRTAGLSLRVTWSLLRIPQWQQWSSRVFFWRRKMVLQYVIPNYLKTKWRVDQEYLLSINIVYAFKYRLPAGSIIWLNTCNSIIDIPEYWNNQSTLLVKGAIQIIPDAFWELLTPFHSRSEVTYFISTSLQLVGN